MRRAALGRQQHRPGQRGKGDVRRAQAVTNQIASAIGELFIHLPKHRPCALERAHSALRRDAVCPAHQRPADRHDQRQPSALARRHLALPHFADQVRVGEHLSVAPAPRVRAQLGVEALLQRLDLAAQCRIARIQPVATGRIVRVMHDVGGIHEAPALVREHRHRAAQVPPRRQPMEQRHVRLFAVRQPDMVERPARLLAVVAQRDGDEDGGLHCCRFQSRGGRILNECPQRSRRVPGRTCHGPRIIDLHPRRVRGDRSCGSPAR